MMGIHQLRCTGCAREIAQEALGGSFRCAECGDLYEVTYPGWNGGNAIGHMHPNPSALRWLWRERRLYPSDPRKRVQAA